MGQKLRQSQRLGLGFRQLETIRLLSLSNDMLAEYLAQQAADNPLLHLRRRPAMAFAPQEPVAHDDGLYAHVLAQLPLIVKARSDLPKAMVFLEALDPSGWLGQPLAALAAKLDLPLAAAEQLLSTLQNGIEPTGLFARDLAECLRLQALERDEYDAAMALLLAHLPQLPEALSQLGERHQIAPAALQRAFDRLRRYAPQPGRGFGHNVTWLRAPDVILSQHSEGWRIALNHSTLPTLELHPAPRGMAKAQLDAQWLAESVARRNRTVLAVVRAVLRHQPGYLAQGPRALCVLNRSLIATELGLHASTVGRIAQELLLQTPFGIIALQSLFSPMRGSGSADGGSGGGSGGGGGLAPRALQQRLAQLIAGENPAKPHSDRRLCELLAAEGQPIARRTVSKFRQATGIEPSSLRRRP